MKDRFHGIQSFLEAKRIDYFLVKNPIDIRWLTGFKASNALVIIPQTGAAVLATDSRYGETAETICRKKNLEFILMDGDFGAKFAAKFYGKIAVDTELALAEFRWLKTMFQHASFRSFNAVIKKFRAEKNLKEIAYTRQAAQHTSEVLAAFFPWLKAQQAITEAQAAFELEHRLRAHGKYGIAFDSIVAFGENSAIPHHASGDRTLQKNENILIDCGAVYQGYHADITRNDWNGATVDPLYAQKYQLLLTVQQRATQKITAGQKIAQLCQSVRTELGDEAAYFTHSLGHGTGLEIHELPNVSIRVKKNLHFKTNQIVTCEPGLYYPGQFGIRIEDQIVVGEQGNEILSMCPHFLKL